MAQPKKSRFGAPPAADGMDIDAFINGSSADSQEKLRHDKTVAVAPVVENATDTAPAAAVVTETIEAKTTQTTPATTSPAAHPTQPATDKPKRGRPAKSKTTAEDEPDEQGGKPAKFLFELPYQENEALRDYAYNTRKSKAEILRQALKEYLKRNQ